MRNKVTTYFHEIKTALLNKVLLHSSAEKRSSKKVFIAISPQECAFLYAECVPPNKPIIQYCDAFSYQDKETLQTTLSNIVDKYSIKNASCSLILQPEDYQLILTDELPVPDAEFQAAIRWKIKDLLRFPLHDLVIDKYPIPKTSTSHTNKIMVVAAEASKLEMLHEQINQCGLILHRIDVPELCLKNTVNVYEDHDKSALLIYVQEKYIQLLIIAKKQLYVSRQLMFSLDASDKDKWMQSIERLISEAERSFDYYQNQWGEPPPEKIIFSSIKPISEEEMQFLSQCLTIPITLFNMANKIESKKTLTETEQSKYLMMIGALLGEEETT